MLWSSSEHSAFGTKSQRSRSLPGRSALWICSGAGGEINRMIAFHIVGGKLNPPWGSIPGDDPKQIQGRGDAQACRLNRYGPDQAAVQQVFTLHRFIACPRCHPTRHQRSSRSLRELAILMTALPDIRRPLLRLRDPAQLLHSQGADRPRRPGQARAAKAPRGFDSLSLASPQSDPDLRERWARARRSSHSGTRPRGSPTAPADSE